MKVVLGIVGAALIAAGLFQGLSLSGIIGDYREAIAGYAGGSIPAVLGAIGGGFLTVAFMPERDEDEDEYED